jgi:hypothetical protein
MMQRLKNSFQCFDANVGEVQNPIDTPQNNSLKINALKAPAGRQCL